MSNKIVIFNREETFELLRMALDGVRAFPGVKPFESPQSDLIRVLMETLVINDGRCLEIHYPDASLSPRADINMPQGPIDPTTSAPLRKPS